MILSIKRKFLWISCSYLEEKKENLRFEHGKVSLSSYPLENYPRQPRRGLKKTLEMKTLSLEKLGDGCNLKPENKWKKFLKDWTRDREEVENTRRKRKLS